MFAPIIISNDKVFTTKQTVTVTAINPKIKQLIKYTTNGTEPNKNSIEYTKPITINSSTILKAKVFTENDSSLSTTTQLYKLPNNYKIKITGKVNSQYSAMGEQTLIDGLYGPKDWRKGEWLGYQGQDIEIMLDLNTPTNLNSISLNFLQDSRSWIILPKQVEYLFSNDNKQFTSLSTLQTKTDPKDENVITEFFTFIPETIIKYRYLKLKFHTLVNC
ncbi:MAG: chitobiase/beta-hexosaminidase C-terminal domain-containing protein [Bacteroidia bacterium]